MSSSFYLFIYFDEKQLPKICVSRNGPREQEGVEKSTSEKHRESIQVVFFFSMMEFWGIFPYYQRSRVLTIDFFFFFLKCRTIVSNLPIAAGILGWVGEVWVLVVLWIACGATPLALWRFDRQDGYLQILKELDCRLSIKGWPTQLNYLQFSLLYRVEDFQLRWKPKDLCLCKVWIKHSNKGLWVFFFWVHNSILDQFTLEGKGSGFYQALNINQPAASTPHYVVSGSFVDSL